MSRGQLIQAQTSRPNSMLKTHDIPEGHVSPWSHVSQHPPEIVGGPRHSGTAVTPSTAGHSPNALPVQEMKQLQALQSFPP
jgi:hypothetical protein